LTQVVPIGRVVRATIRLAGAAPDPLLKRAIGVTWEPGKTEPDVRLAAEKATQLIDFITALRRGRINFGMIRAAASDLGSLLGASRLEVGEHDLVLLELTADGATTLLTEVPWEAAAWGSAILPEGNNELFARLLASLAVCRLVPGILRDVAIGAHRPRLLLCISNPPGIDGGQISVRPIEIACQQTLQLYPVFQVKTLSGQLTWSAVAPVIPQFQPNVLIFVGHGSSNPEGGEPTLAFVREGDPGGVNRMPVAKIAELLTRAGSCCLLALIACDTVRASGYSAACEFVRQGVEEVVAMQGSIEQQSARAILESIFAETLVGSTLPAAAAAARRAAKDRPHAIMPAVFRSAHRDRNASTLGPLSALYGQALGALCERVRETGAIFARNELQKRIEEFLARSGIAAVGGGYGNGSSFLLRAAVASLLGGPSGRNTRPIIYIDCDRRIGDEPLMDRVSRSLIDATTSYCVLRPKNSPNLVGSMSAREVGTWAVEAEISVVLDNVPFQPSEDETEFVKDFSGPYGRGDGRASLVLGGSGDLLRIAPEAATITVGPLSLEETGGYAKQLMLDADADALYRQTGGTLLLLDAERRSRPQGRPAMRNIDRGGEIVDRYLARLDEWLSPGAREASARLALFSCALDVGLVEEFVTPDLSGAIEELVDAGLATSFDQGGIAWVMIPERKSCGIQRRAGDRETIEGKLAVIFAERYDRDAIKAVHEVASLGGAGAYLVGVQRYLAAADRSDIAVGLPIDAAGTSLSAIDLFRLFEISVQILEIAGHDEPEVLLAATRAALVVGKLIQAETWLGRISSDHLNPTIECRRLMLKAALLKDQGQTGALAEILGCYSRATELAAAALPDRQAEFDRLREEIAFDSLPTALFLGGESAAPASERLAAILPGIPLQERAQLLATLAEREMREPADKVDWTRVAEWVTQAASALDGGSDERVRTYCTYQQAQYLRQRPEPRFVDAWRKYDESKAAGQRAGEPRRAGLALRRLIELERDHEVLRQPPTDWPKRRLREVDDVEPDLLRAHRDALSMRVLGRLQSLAAALDVDLDRRRDRLIEAARALSTRALSSRRDDRVFAQVCAQALDLDLCPKGDFPLAQRFLSTVRSEVGRRLGIQVNLDRPEAARDEISGWLARPN
jgi:hypothetical protein